MTKLEIKKRIKQLEITLWNQNQRLANSFSSKDKNDVIKSTLKLMTLKNLLSGQRTH